MGILDADSTETYQWNPQLVKAGLGSGDPAGLKLSLKNVSPSWEFPSTQCWAQVLSLGLACLRDSASVSPSP